MCWYAAGGCAIRYRELRYTDILTVCDAFLCWATEHGHSLITSAEKQQRLAAARRLMSFSGMEEGGVKALLRQIRTAAPFAFSNLPTH
jgi:hypothetical protein